MIPCILILYVSGALITQDIYFDRTSLTTTQADEYTRVFLPGCDISDEVGAPELPVRSVLVAIPSGAQIQHVYVQSVETHTLEQNMKLQYVCSPVILSQKQVTHKDQPQEQLYMSDNLYPEDIIRYIGTSIFMGQQICELLIYPIQYKPRSGTIEFHERITIVIEYTGGVFKPVHDPSILSMVSNPEKVLVEKLPRNRELLEYVIITNSVLDTVYQRLADWKTKKGVVTKVRTTDWIYSNYAGEDNAARIRNYLKTLSDSTTRYVLLGGDTDVIPPRFAYAMSCSAWIYPGREDTMPADLYYSDLDGTWNFDNDGCYGEIEDSIDLYPDLIVGRAPTSSIADAQKFVEKVLLYEKNPDCSYQEDAVFTADILWSNPYTDQGIHKNKIEAHSIPSGFNVTKLYHSAGTLSPSAVKNSLRQGQGLFNHDGHGWINIMGAGTGNLRNADFDTLTNEPLYGVCASIGCWTTAFDFDCIAESFILSPHGGGVGFIGNTSYGWGSPGNPGFGYSDRYDSRLFHTLFIENNYHLGEILAMTKAHFIPYSRERNVYRWHQYQMTLLGDPEMPVWTAVPETLSIVYPQSIPIGTSRILVSVQDKQTNAPVRNALVCLMKGNESYAADRTDASGNIFVDISPSSSGNADLTVSAQNYLPEEMTIPVVSGPYVNYLGWVINDSLGNNDGVVNPYEDVFLDVMIKNTGNATATNIRLYLRTQDPLAAVSDSTQYVASLNAGDSLYIDNVFRVVVDCATNGHGIVFDLEVTDDSRTLNLSPILLVGTPELVLDEVIISNPPTMPGEQESMHFVIYNTGFGFAHGAYALISCSDPYISIQSDSAYYGDLPPESDTAVIGPFDVSVSASIPAGHHPQFSITFAADDYTNVEYYDLIIGNTGFSDDMESGTGLWTSGGTNNRWHITTYKAYSPTHAWYCGDSISHLYSNSMDCYIQTIPFMIGHNSLLKFYRWLDVPLYGTDGIYVIILNGANADTLDFIGTGGALQGERGIQSDWFEEKYDLASYTPGDTLQLRIAFISDTDGDIGEGFYIDNINVENITLLEEYTCNGLPGVCFSLFPNPFRNTTMIQLHIPQDALGKESFVKVYDVTGRCVRDFVVPVMDAPGPVGLQWDGSDRLDQPLPAGVYFIQLSTPSEKITKKAILVR